MHPLPINALVTALFSNCSKCSISMCTYINTLNTLYSTKPITILKYLYNTLKMLKVHEIDEI